MTDAIFENATSTLNANDITRMLAFDLQDDDLLQISKNIEFSGYDPIITFNIVMTIIGRDESKKKQLLTVIIFGLTRGFGSGKTLESILNRTNPDGRDELEAAFATFRIQFGRPTNKKVITVSRILTAFPILVYKMHDKLVEMNIIDTNSYDGDLPDEFQYPGSPAMMTESTWEIQKDNYLDYIEYLSELWNQDFDSSEALKYAELSYNSKLSPHEHRY